MKDRDWVAERLLAATAFLLVGILVPALVVGCSFSPTKYLSRNACEFFDSEELFFIEDLFPLSAQPTGGAGGMCRDEDTEDAGH